MSGKPILRYVQVYGSRCGITTESLRAVRARVGADNLNQYRNATQADVDHVRGMGGFVPVGRIAKAALPTQN